MTARHPIQGTKRRAEFFALHGGVCHICKGKIAANEAWDVDHVIAKGYNNDNSPENLRPAHVKCHRGAGSKTSKDVTEIARAKRLEAKRLGTFPARKSNMAGNRNSPFKKHLDGTVSRREM